MNKALLVTLLTLPLAANAVDWVDLGKSNDKQLQVFLDYDSVKRQDIKVYGGISSLRTANQKPKYISAVFQSTYINNNPLRKKGRYYSKEQWFISCEDQTYYINAGIEYGFKDEVIDSWRASNRSLSDTDFKYAFPETVGGNNIEEACSSILLKEFDESESFEDFINNNN